MATMVVEAQRRCVIHISCSALDIVFIPKNDYLNQQWNLCLGSFLFLQTSMSDTGVRCIMQVETSIFAMSFKNSTVSLPPELDSVSCGLNMVFIFFFNCLPMYLI